MYFLLGEIKNALDGLNIKSQEDLQGDLYKTWKELDNASEDFKKKREQWEHLKAELEAKQKEFESLGVDRVKNILASIGDM
jgi:chromosome segregation ATPase